MIARVTLRFLLGMGLISGLSACGFDTGSKATANRANLDNVCPAARIDVPAGIPSGIIGGEIASPTSWTARQTVMIVQVAGHERMETCTGTLVARNVVLTAAHCVAGDNNKAFVVFKTRPNQGELNVLDPNQVAAVDAVRVHPHYRISEDGHVGSCTVANASGRGDIALIHMRTPAPKTMDIAQLVQRPYYWTDLDRVTVAGYGDTVGGTSTDQAEVALRVTTLEPLRRSEIEAIRVRSNMAPSTFAHMFDTSLNAENIWLKQLSGHGVCNGDSGGPSFIQQGGRMYQIGVLSAVTGNGADRCNGFGLTTNVLFYKDWLEQTFEELTSGAQLFR